MKKRKTLLALCSLALVAALAVGGTLAYLTDTTEATKNNFTVGKVEITVEEEWEEPTEPLKPGDEKEKEPSIKTTDDSEESYVFMMVTMPYVANGTVLNADGTKNETLSGEKVDYFDLLELDTANWQLVISDKTPTVDGKNVYVYAYATSAGMTRLGKGSSTGSLFKKIKLRNIIELAPNGKESIDITGYAIQADNIKDADGNEVTAPQTVWEYVLNQKALEPAKTEPTPGA